MHAIRTRGRPVAIITLLGVMALLATGAAAPERDLTTRELLTEIRSLLGEVKHLRQELAEARLRADRAERDRDELRQFILDHEEYGRDFEQYRALRVAAEADARRRAADEVRLRRERERSERQAQRALALADRRREQAESDRLDRYADAGFSPIGLDVLIGRMAYYYSTRQVTRTVLENNRDLIVYPVSQEEIDYSRMTISGSVINAAEEVRNVGVAVAFFDESGNQVGAETIRIANARPDVPYPFTSTLEVALNRPFDSSSVYVLYADVSGADGGGEGAAP